MRAKAKTVRPLNMVMAVASSDVITPMVMVAGSGYTSSSGKFTAVEDSIAAKPQLRARVKLRAVLTHNYMT